jgi:CheY-like chemotaxis protein
MEQPACRVSGSEMLSALSDISALLRSSASVSETLSSLLAELCKIFDGEGALLWLVDDSHEVLKQRQHYHANGERSKAFETEASSTTVFFGDGIVGRVWAQGEPSILQLPAMFAQEPNPGEHSSAAKRDGSAVYCLTLPLLAGGTVYGAIEIVNCGVSSIDDSQRLFLHILSLQLGGFIAAHDALERASHQQEHVEHLIRRLKQMDNDLREAKSRLSGAHDDLIQASLSQGQFLAQISLDLRTPLSGIMSVAELIERTSLTSQQSELILIIKQSAESILHVLQQTIETTEEETRRFVQTQAELLVQESGSLPSEEARESLADARILVLHGLVGSAEFIEPFAIASGINCQAASRGYSGITAMRQAALAGRPFDVVFVERVLPDMDGLDFARAVREERQLASTKLVLVSTFGASGLSDPASEAGFDAHIAKPIKQAQVLNTIEAILRGTSVRAAVESSQNAAMPAATQGKHVILVAEDNPVNQKVTLLQLKELGFFAEVVNNGKEAVEAACHGTYDAILMDLQMPELDGFEATK